MKALHLKNSIIRVIHLLPIKPGKKAPPLQFGMGSTKKKHMFDISKLCYPPGNQSISHQTGKGTSSTQKCQTGIGICDRSLEGTQNLVKTEPTMRRLSMTFWIANVGKVTILPASSSLADLDLQLLQLNVICLRTSVKHPSG